MTSFQSSILPFEIIKKPSDNSIVATPVSIPNTVVKHDNGDDSGNVKVTSC